MALTEQAIQTMTAGWYQALDRHDDLADVLPYLVDDGLEMRFPEATARGHTGFADWYKAVTNRFFDEAHTLTSVEVRSLSDQQAEVTVVVNWQARIWNPPAARSQWLGFDAYQTWELVAGPAGQPQIKTYVVDSLAPMPGSASL
jgi:hypothetical protein